MNKKELIQRIEHIPKFVLRDAAVKEAQVINLPGEDLVDSFKWTEAENWRAVTEEGNFG